jgi:hypothetical protein
MKIYCVNSEYTLDDFIGEDAWVLTVSDSGSRKYLKVLSKEPYGPCYIYHANFIFMTWVNFFDDYAPNWSIEEALSRTIDVYDWEIVVYNPCHPDVYTTEELIDKLERQLT